MNRLFKTIALFSLILISCSKGDENNDPVILNDENLITSFKLTINTQLINGIIDQNAKTISFDLVGADLDGLVPQIEYSDRATLSPAENEVQNFNNEVVYTVYAENGNPNVYRVLVQNRPLSEENKILSFVVNINSENIEASINNDEHLITFNSGTFNITSLEPSISISENATISPDINLPQDFSNTVFYTVTAENGNSSEYKVIANPPNITGLSCKVGVFTNYPILLYVRADILIIGDFVDPNRPNAELYLTDGINNYPLPVLTSEVYSANEYISTFVLSTKIPENIPTNSNYKIVYGIDDLLTESESYLDIVAENFPVPLSLNQDLYERYDVLIMTGQNLPDMIAIPSNGSIFLIENSNNYDLTVNPERTELTLTLDYTYLFPSYFGNDPEQKIITLLGPNRRAGETITTIFE